MKLNANRERIKDRINMLSSLSERGIGVNRPTYSDSWKRAIAYLKEIMISIGMNVKLDPFGNLIGETQETNLKRKPVAIGSHIDTVTNGGAYDGAMGIVVALECMSLLRGNSIDLERPIHVIAFAEEEGSLFGIGCLGSRYMVGNKWKKDLLNIVDRNSITLKEHLLNLGTKDEFEGQFGWAAKKYHAFIEPHIEQGPYLEKWDKTIGIVNKVVAISRTKVTFHGKANHAGTTPMNYRKDASIGMARFILKVEEKGKALEDKIVATVGEVILKPNLHNVIPGTAQTVMEIRSADDDLLSEVKQNLKDIALHIGRELDLGVEISKDLIVPSQNFDNNILEILKKVCKKEDIKYAVIQSWAGHDAKIFAPFFPSAMIMVPSKDGISHSPNEFSKIDDIALATKVLIRSLDLLNVIRAS